ncbi:MAG: sucrase ferredoxin [Cyanobacteria bacterium P01_H01_bin.26]
MDTAAFASSELLTGTAVPADTFILLETPTPWDKPALLSAGVPESLRQVIKPLLKTGIRVHLIADGQTPHRDRRRILIFQRSGKRSDSGFGPLAGGYRPWEIQVDSPADMAPALDGFFRGSRGRSQTLSGQRHLMVCTHASHNECCGLYGYPFYQDTILAIQQLGLTQQVQPWQISHIGGHRFAPTLIDFPQGRYYGNLDRASLLCLLKQQGTIEPLLATYRGWSLLPKPLQILEAELLRQHRWDWLRGRVAGRILKQTTSRVWAELWFEAPGESLLRYTAEIHDNRLCRLEPAAPASLLIHRKTG